MAHKEYGVTDILDILRRAQAGDSIRRIAKATGMDRKTISNYLRIAAEHGFLPVRRKIIWQRLHRRYSGRYMGHS